MSKATLALTAHLDLIEWVAKGDGLTWWDEQMIGAIEENGGELDHGVLDLLVANPRLLRSMPGLSQQPVGVDQTSSLFMAMKNLPYAETVFVSRAMCDVIEHAAKTMPDVPLQEENLMWPSSFVYFERPIHFDHEINDFYDRAMDVRAIYMFSDQRVIPAEEAVGSDWFENAGELMKPGLIHITFSDTDSEATRFSYEDVGSRLFAYDMSGWTYGKRWATVPGEEVAPGKVDEGLSLQRKLLLAVNLIAAQHVAVVRRESGQRQVKRRAQRMDMPNYGDISYITLRREDQGGHEGDREPGEGYSYRFMVSGHWRHQWYPSKGEHHLIWIDPFIKGPEDRPLIIKDKVWKVVR